MEKYITLIIIGIAIIIGLIILIKNIVEFCKLTAEQKREKLIAYLMGLVSYAEEKIGKGNGDKKMQEVEDYFAKNAPYLMKLVFKFLKVNSLKELIEEALVRIKNLKF